MAAILLACGWLLILSGTTARPILAHGAIEGLHLHVKPDPARPGERVRIRVDAVEPITEVTLGWADGETVTRKLKKSSRRVPIRMKVPKHPDRPVLSLQAEATTASGKKIRTSALVRIRYR